MFRKGPYKMLNGLTAVVSTLKSVGQNDWVLFGYIPIENILYLHAWDIQGASKSNLEEYNLEPK